MKSHHIIQETRTNESEWTTNWRSYDIDECMERINAKLHRGRSEHHHQDQDVADLCEMIKDAIRDAYLAGRGERK